MLYIILCIPLYVLNSFCDKYISVGNNKGANALYNIIKFTIGSIILLPAFLGDGAKYEWIVVICGILCGVMYAISKTIILDGYEKTSVAFMTFCHSSGLLLPCISGHFLFGEKITVISLLGILLVIASFIFLKETKKSGTKRSLHGTIIGIIVLLTSGGVMILQKIMGIYSPGVGVNAYNFYSFISAFLLIMLFSRKTVIKEKISKKSVLCGAGSAVALCTISIVMTFLASSVPSVIMFPVFNGSGIIAVTLLSAVFFKEKLTVKKLCGMALGLIGLFLINI